MNVHISTINMRDMRQDSLYSTGIASTSVASYVRAKFGDMLPNKCLFLSYRSEFN